MTAVDHAGDVAYALEVARRLWPEPWQPPEVVRHGPASGSATRRELYVFPSASRPRLLLPVDVPAATSMLGRLGKDRSRLSRVGRRLLLRVAASPAFSLLRWPRLAISAAPGPEPDSIDRYLSTVLGREVRVGVVLGTPRANQKPVLKVFSREGQLVGYAKIGHNPLTAALVRRETETLTRLQAHQPQHFRAPQVLHAGQWRGLEVLVMSALSGSPGFHTPAPLRVAAMRELATLAGTDSRPLSSSDYWQRITREVEQVTDPAARQRLQKCAETVHQRCGATVLQLGAWHGDWGHWNMALDGDTVQLWDWERFDSPVPLGFDALHHAAQGVRPGSRAFADQQARFPDQAHQALRELGVPPEVWRLTLALYFLEISVRYAASLDFSRTPALQRRAAWALSLLEDQVAQLPLEQTNDVGGPA